MSFTILGSKICHVFFSQQFVCLFVFVLGLSSHSRIFHSYGDVTITGEGLQILTFVRHSWWLSSEGSLACHTSCDYCRSLFTLLPLVTPHRVVITSDNVSHSTDYHWSPLTQYRYTLIFSHTVLITSFYLSHSIDNLWSLLTKQSSLVTLYTLVIIFGRLLHISDYHWATSCKIEGWATSGEAVLPFFKGE